MNQERVVGAVYELLAALGFDTTDEAIKDTPARVARAWREQLDGYGHTAERVLGTIFRAEYDEIVLLRDIPFYSTCEHHLLPFHGVAHVAYIPGEGRGVVGLSKLARLVDMHARRLQLQERLTQSIAVDLERVLGAKGVAVIVSAQHLCMCARGIKKAGASMSTSVMRGVFRAKPEARAELLQLIEGARP